MRLPTLNGTIKRRLLINFRADPATVRALLPPGFRPKLHKGFAMVGICLIRLEEIRPKGLPTLIGVSSENAAHRIAVEWTDADGTAREGVFIPRRDTNSRLSVLAGGRIFPGEHHHSKFTVRDTGDAISLAMKSDDHECSVEVEATVAEALPTTSIFASLAEASNFFENGCTGYSVTSDPSRLDGIVLKTEKWEVNPLAVSRVLSTYFSDETRFPPGSIEFDHGLIMRDIPHEWHSAADFQVVLADDFELPLRDPSNNRPSPL